ncbi:MAG: pyridoxal-phosphate dependent enzyme [Chloroflexi bacterium]|nr:pyridoxal-phosphate dependent enzyme [Chloroflexota bacterium]
MTDFQCTSCLQAYPDAGIPFRCPNCGGKFGIAGNINYDPEDLEPDLSGLWRYRGTFGLPADAPVITLGEGDTPLVNARLFDRDVALKLEYLNPTGSFKDRLTAPEMSFLVSRGVTSAVEDSSGNAGASFAAYSARAGVKGRVYIPDYASGPKRIQIEAYGAKVVPIEGPRSNAAKAVREAVEKEGIVYASHAYLPHGLPGLATIAYELVEQMGEAPGTVIAPVGHGSLMLGIFKGFAAMLEAGIIGAIPTLVGVQASACAPVWTAATLGPDQDYAVGEGHTLAEGVRVKYPVHGDALVQSLQENSGLFLTVEEHDIGVGQDTLARLGFFIEPTSAIVWSALKQVVDKAPEPIVLILTGSGLKG